MLVLCLTLVQGSSMTLSIAFYFQDASATLERLVNLVWALTYLLALLGLVTTFGINWITWMVRYRLLMTLLLAGTAFSAIWSMDAALTLQRTVHLIGSSLIALYIGFSIPLSRILTATAIMFGVLLLGSAVVVYGIPALGLENYEGRQVWRGITASKNTLGFWSAVAILLFASLLSWPLSLDRKALLIIGLLLAVPALIFSVSATSVLALLIGILVMVYLFVAFRFRLGLVAMIVLGALFTLLASLAFLQIDTAELIGRSGDLTGRSEVWVQTWQLILQKPLTGYGYGTIWYPTADSLWIQQALTDLTWTTFHAHNGLLQIASEIGLPLTVLALLMILQQLIEIIYCQYQRQQAGVLFVLGFTVALLVSNYTEARLLVNRELYWILFIALPISMLQQVSVVLPDTSFNPVPANLPRRTRRKMINIAADRLHRRELKKRLSTRRKRALTLALQQSQGNIIDAAPADAPADTGPPASTTPPNGNSS